MQFKFVTAGVVALALAACGEAEQTEYLERPTSYAVAESASPTEATEEGLIVERLTALETEEPTASPADGIEPERAVAAPQIAYRYSLGFRVPSDAIKPLSEQHADMCEAMGVNTCRIIEMGQSDSDGDYGYGNLQLAVAADEAREFTKQLEASSGEMDGEVVSSSINGEDLSKQIVDTEAKLRARTLLRDRLMEILRSRKGTVAELVEAERAVAQVNQEIDQARSWLNEMRGRVAFSQLNIRYTSGAPSSGGFSDPIRSAFASIGSILGNMIAFFVLALTVLLPLGLVVWIIWQIWRRVRPEPAERNDDTRAETRPAATIKSSD